MEYSFEVTLQGTAKDLFHQAFASHLETRGYIQTALGGVGQEILGFRRDDHLVSFSVSSEGHWEYKVTVHSETVAVDDLVLAVLQEAASMLIEPFCKSLTGRMETSFREPVIRGIDDLLTKVRQGKG